MKANFQPVTWERYRGLRWKKSPCYRFTSGFSLVHLVAAELPQAVMSLPVGFTKQGGDWVPTAILSFQPHDSLFVDSEGKWSGSYVPSVFRFYPFKTSFISTGEQILCFDENSGLFCRGEGECFFESDGTLSAAVREVLRFMESIEASRLLTVAAARALDRHGLIEPWPLSVVFPDGRHPLSGCYRINEQGLHDLSADALHEVSLSGGLALAYSLLLSMQHIATLEQFFKARASERIACDVDRFLAQNSVIPLEGLSPAISCLTFQY